ncbi:helix-turn-helix domain-containing protein [Streptomyces sp. SID13666]|uniref:helix-turn-helix domain-containing protein n=1 Tax=unclassified Streptomyces TaxID=2593676 RepID=UPI0013C1CBD9|nr:MULTISPECIES: helix-turn-helix domain-containing protein [unclassified Streptomyces]NEA60372.1 helix-turn-helix domain-containing protein [Streptomyces sp. SID13666]NEA76766.1 helix-turn-helix domain-containing protein [Streptomyces sp. SID13588]
MTARGMFGRVREALFPSRKAPAHSPTQAVHVRDKMFGGSTKAMAQAYGVSQRTVERWIDGTRKPPELSHAAERRWEAENTARARQGRPPLPRPTTSADRLATDAVRAQTTARGRQRKAKQLAQLGTFSGHTARVGRATTFNIRGSDAVRSRDVHVTLTGEQAAALALADDEDQVRTVIGQALADYFNGGASGGFRPEDFEWDENDFGVR